jgi:ABC-type protease/lipase transport system fused ATPase/permease subunit
VVVIAHRLNLLITTDALMVLQKGVITQFGKTSEIMPQITRPVAVQPETSLSAKFAG